MIKISIIIPMFNCSNTIKTLIYSIEKQSVPAYEVILINDGSTDNTLEIVYRLCESKKNYVILNQENKGAPVARNKGIEYATGEYLYFCDSDDILDVNTLKILSNAMICENADLVVGNVSHFENSGKIIKTYKACTYRDKVLGIYRFYKCDPIPGSKLYKKSIIDKYQIWFDEVKIGQDLNFYLKYLLVSKKNTEVNKTVYYYRHTDNSISRTYKISNIMDIRKSMEYIFEFLDKNKLINGNEIKIRLEYIKLGNYVWQLRKYKCFKNEDYQILRKSLCEDEKKFNLLFCISNMPELIEFYLIKFLNLNIRYL